MSRGCKCLQQQVEVWRPWRGAVTGLDDAEDDSVEVRRARGRERESKASWTWRVVVWLCVVRCVGAWVRGQGLGPALQTTIGCQCAVQGRELWPRGAGEWIIEQRATIRPPPSAAARGRGKQYTMYVCMQPEYSYRGTPSMAVRQYGCTRCSYKAGLRWQQYGRRDALSSAHPLLPCQFVIGRRRGLGAGIGQQKYAGANTLPIRR